MKWTALFVLFLMFASVFVPCLSVRADPSLIVHEDPSDAQSVLDSYSFLVQYTDIFAFMSSRQYDNASQLSEQLSQITVPQGLSDVIKGYNDLTKQLINVLNDLNSTLDRAFSFLDQFRLGEAGQELNNAGVLVAKAQILFSDLQDETVTLSQRLGVFSTPVESKIPQAYSQLQSMVQRLKDPIDFFHTLLTRANQGIEEIQSKKLDSTSLSLGLNATKCFVGRYISASGILTSNGSALQNRVVELFLDGNQVASASTDAKGLYFVVIRVPFKYADNVSVSALYTPQGNDKGVYLASVSPTINVQVLFYRTILDISVTNVAYPGLSLTVNGNVTSQDGAQISERQVKVLLDGSIIAQTETDLTGGFMAKPIIAAQAKLGVHTLAVTADPVGLYNGAAAQRTLTIQKMASTIQVTMPSSIMPPSQIHINGTVKSASGPLNGASVQVEFANVSSITETVGDGSFNFTIDAPFNTVFVGYQDLTVSAQPSQPWQFATQKTVSVFVLNSVSVSLALASSLAVVFVMYFKFAKTKGRRSEKSTITSTVFSLPASGVSVTVAPAISEMKFKGLKGNVLKAYIETLQAVQTATRISLLPDMTLREYLQASGSKMGEALEAFSELTALAERSLYSPHAPNEKDAEKAENLAIEIGRRLNGGIV